MPKYRLIFPPRPGRPASEAPTAYVEVDEELKVGSLVEHEGRRWQVTEAPLDQPVYGSTKDVMVWPAP